MDRPSVRPNGAEPRARGTSAHRAPRSRRAARPGGAVLIADADQAVGELIRATLTTEGYDAVFVSDVSVEAIRRVVAVWKPDCLLVESPSHTGHDAFWDIAALMDTGGRAVPVVVLTDNLTATADVFAGAGERGRTIAAALQKPIDARSVAVLVRRVVREGSAEPV
jgi:CheY-like chemotaxis protein